MNDPKRLSRQQYAVKYDEHAGSFYKFALCVIGDRNKAEESVAKLFCEGYINAGQKNFVWHMLDILRRILESCPPDPDSYRERIKDIFPEPEHWKRTELLGRMTVSQRAKMLQKLMFEKKELGKSAR